LTISFRVLALTKLNSLSVQSDLAWVTVNAMEDSERYERLKLAVTGAGFFWPIFPILGWGIGVAANAWDVYGRKPISEDEIRCEAERLRGGGGM